MTTNREYDSQVFGSWNWCLSTNVMEWDEKNFTLLAVSPQNFNKQIDGFFKLITAQERAQFISDFEKAVATGSLFTSSFSRVTPEGIKKFFTVGKIIYRDQEPIQVVGFNYPANESSVNSSVSEFNQ